MMKDLLVRGMVAGILAAVFATLFARIFAEPQVDLAIAVEAAHAAHAHGMAMAAEPGPVSRAVQKGWGLLTAILLYGAAVGGLFAILFALAYGRVGRIGPRGLALLMAAAGFVAVALVPALKYPPTPPAVGLHETVAFRTLAYFGMIGGSLVSLVLAKKLAGRLVPVVGAIDGWLIAVGGFVALVLSFGYAMPVVNEVPADFPATLLWNFRIAAIGTQALLWTVLAVGFGVLAERRITRPARA